MTEKKVQSLQLIQLKPTDYLKWAHIFRSEQENVPANEYAR